MSTIIDRRGEVPDLVPYLRPTTEERVINVDQPATRKITANPSAFRELKKLTAVESVDEIGTTGPVVAARVSTENQEVEELRNFEVLFGRDALRVAIDLGEKYPKLLYVTIRRLGELQGLSENIMSEEQPGRIVHEFRDSEDEIAKRKTEEDGWQWPYYGSVDATVSYVRAIKQYCDLSNQGAQFLNEKLVGKDGQQRTVGESLQMAIGWIKTRLDSNPEGLLEFKKLFDGSLENQTWKDSWDAYSHADGTIANHEGGIASIEIQGLTYDALIDAAELYETLGGAEKEKEVADLRTRAEKIKLEIREKFWTEDERGGYYVIGTDRDDRGELRQLRIRTSNMGHLLNSRLLDGDDPETVRRREAIITTLFSPEMLNASGIRTLSNREKQFKPGGYHNGNVWPWDTYYISQGLERQGYYGLAWNLNRRIWNVVDTTKMFPEFARGGDDPKPVLNTRIVDVWDVRYQRKNRIEQLPQEIQAWTVAAMLSIETKHYEQIQRHNSLPTANDPQKNVLEDKILKSIWA